MATADAFISDARSVEQAFADLSIDSSFGRQPQAASQVETVAGLGEVVDSLRELIGTSSADDGVAPSGITAPKAFTTGWPLLYNKEGTALGVCWPKGLLLHGPPGCGKTLVTRSVAAEFDAEVYEISAANVFGAYTGASCPLAL